MSRDPAELLRMSDGGGVRKGRATTQLSIVIRQVLTRVIWTRKGRWPYMPQDRITIMRRLYGGRSGSKFT